MCKLREYFSLLIHCNNVSRQFYWRLWKYVLSKCNIKLYLVSILGNSGFNFWWTRIMTIRLSDRFISYFLISLNYGARYSISFIDNTLKICFDNKILYLTLEQCSLSPFPTGKFYEAMLVYLSYKYFSWLIFTAILFIWSLHWEKSLKSL